MARKHWRFTVRDARGNAIQNALVYVYQPGTSTVFTDTAYDAYTGGDPVTNPFTTGAQGDVEAFFDTAQRVDVFVTDNDDAAYKAAEGPNATVSFTSFTEKDTVYHGPEDN